MSQSFFAFHRLKRQLVARSTNPYYKGKYALVTDVTHFANFDRVTETMQRAAECMPDAFYLHFKCETELPADIVRVIPTILQSFNRTRTMRRARVSGIRLCNLVKLVTGWHYISDMVVSCAFDAVALAAGLAEYSSLGAHIMVRCDVPTPIARRGERAMEQFAAGIIDKFWRRSRIARHCVRVAVEDVRKTGVVLCFEPLTVSHIALLSYILNALTAIKGLHVEVGRNHRLIIGKQPLWTKDDYLVYPAANIGANYRYRRVAAFGSFYHNPDYLLY